MDKVLNILIFVSNFHTKKGSKLCSEKMSEIPFPKLHHHPLKIKFKTMSYPPQKSKTGAKNVFYEMILLWPEKWFVLKVPPFRKKWNHRHCRWWKLAALFSFSLHIYILPLPPNLHHLVRRITICFVHCTTGVCFHSIWK